MEPTTTQEPGSSLTVPMVLGLALIAMLVLGGLYFWQGEGATMESAYSDVDSESWMPAEAGGTDDAAEIQAELEATNMDAFEQHMNADAEAAASSI